METYDNHNRENNDLNKENIQGDESQTVQTLLFPFGMIQTPFQIMLNWPVKFRNNIDDSSTYFLSNSL